MSRFPRCPGKDKTSMSQKFKSQRDIWTTWTSLACRPLAESLKSEKSLVRSSVINFNESSEDSILDDEALEQRLVALKDDSEKRILRSVIRTPKCPVDPGMPTQYQLVFSDAEMYEHFEINAEQFEHDAHIRFAKNGETKVVVCGLFYNFFCF